MFKVLMREITRSRDRHPGMLWCFFVYGQARNIRIMCEYEETLLRLKRNKIKGEFLLACRRCGKAGRYGVLTLTVEQFELGCMVLKLMGFRLDQDKFNCCLIGREKMGFFLTFALKDVIA